MRFRFHALALLFLFTLMSCGEEVSRVLVYVTADATVSPALETVEVEVSRDGEVRSGQRFEIVPEDDEAPPDRVALPLSFVLEADDPGSYAVTVSVVGLTAGGSVQRDAAFSFVSGEDRAAIVLLTGDCVNVECEAGLTCANGECVGATTPTVDLATARERVLQVDCGNGLVELAEGCDDGNDDDGDGCDACIVEEGYSCTGGPSVCEPVCGDGRRIDGEEDCDDGNRMPGDGCSADCTVEPGWGCEATTCLPVCGDGNVTGDEECDDDNDHEGDGCASCMAEDGFICDASGCRADCGDGLLVRGEECDDGNDDEADGCDSACRIEAGFLCPEPGERCVPNCGDRIIVADEECDDGNDDVGDGCVACMAEEGFSCDPAGCRPICGDGMIVVGEECDDRNETDDDGCSSECRREPGFVCGTPGDACAPDCGDGIIVGDEECDDGNTVRGDGCGRSCRVERGWTCDETVAIDPCEAICGDGMVVGDEVCDEGTEANPAFPACQEECTRVIIGFTCDVPGERCTTTCGDGVLGVPTENCDDGNTRSGDGCDASCRLEDGWSCPFVGDPCALCGNGIIEGREDCDDGNLSSSDGCSSTCRVERGFNCPEADRPCESICGDTFVVGAEECDDGGAELSPGCSDLCTVEPGYVCDDSEPSVCVPV